MKANIKRKYTGIIFALHLLSYLSISAQTSGDSIRIQDRISITRADDTKWIKRYQQSIDEYEIKNKCISDSIYDVLFLGSSSINRWNDIDKDMKPLRVIKRSYGGATIRDMIYNYNTIARGYNVGKIVLYVENDLGTKPESISPGECYDLFRVFIQMLQRDYPRIPVYIISFKPSFAKKIQIQDQLLINRLLKDYATKTSFINYIDITKSMYNENGNLKEDIFGEDRLHLNRKGYELWTKDIKLKLLEKDK